MPALRASAAALAVLVVVPALGCSSDLFHATDWQTRCEANPDAIGCHHGSSSSASSTATTGGGGGQGGEGGAATGGGGGAGGAGGSACLHCSELLLMTQLTVPADAFCTTAGEAAHAALRACACEATCVVECVDPCGGGAINGTCTSCVTGNCMAQVDQCNLDQ